MPGISVHIGGLSHYENTIREADFIKEVAILGFVLIHVTVFSLWNLVPTIDGSIYLAINQISRFSVLVFFMLSGLFLFQIILWVVSRSPMFT